MACITPLFADTIYFKDGTSIEGEITQEGYSSVTIKEHISNTVTRTTECLKSAILKIEKGPTKEAIKLSQDIAREKQEQKEIKDKAAAEKKAEAGKYASKESREDKKPKEKSVKLAHKTAQESQKKEKNKEKTPEEIPPGQPGKPSSLKKALPDKVSTKDKIAVAEAHKASQDTAKEKGKTEGKEKTASPKTGGAVKDTGKDKRKVKVLEYKLIMRKEKRFIGDKQARRMENTIVVSSSATDEDLKAIFPYVLKKELMLNKNLNALWIVVYTNKDMSGLPRAYGIWSPPGGWGDFRNITDKSKYKWEYRFIYSK